MRRLLSLALLASVHAQASAQDVDALRPDTVLEAPGRPRLVVLRSATAGIAALRLSVPLAEHASEAGAGAALAALAAERMEGPARQVGALIRAERTPWGLAYHVQGAEIDIDYLTYVLRLAAAAPDPGPAAMTRVREQLEATLDRRAESPLERLLRDIRSEAAPYPPIEGTLGSLLQLGPARLREVWSRSHRPERMTVVVETSLGPEPFLAMLDRLGDPQAPIPEATDAPVPAEPPASSPPALRSWFGEAWVDASPLDPHAEVVAAMIGHRLSSGPAEFEMSARLWRLRDRAVLAVIGATYPRAATAMRAEVASTMDDLLVSLTAANVAAAVSETSLAVRLRARTPSGLVDEVGRALDATGDPAAAASYLARMESVTVESLRAYIARLGSPIVVELRP